MIRFYTSRDLARRFKINLAKWKRWAREFLPPDPLGGMQSGYARQYHPDQAFSVLVGGHLVADHKFSIPQARRVLADLKPWMRHNGFFYGASVSRAAVNQGTDLPNAECRILIYQLKNDELYYTICSRFHRTVSVTGKEVMVSDRFLEIRIPEQHGCPEEEAPCGCCVIFLMRLLKFFTEALDLPAEHYAALNGVK